MALTPQRRLSRRRTWLVNRPLQLRFVKAMLVILCVMAVASVVAVFIAIRLTRVSFQLASEPAIRALLDSVGWLIFLELLALTPVVVCLGILLTHKVAGPLLRIQAALAQMAKGNFDIHLTLRKQDELIELAEVVNQLADSLRRRFHS